MERNTLFKDADDGDFTTTVVAVILVGELYNHDIPYLYDDIKI